MKNKELSLQKKNKIALKAHKKLIQAKNWADIAYLFVGKQLKEIKEKEFYKYLGDSPEYESFRGYIRSPEVNMDARKAYYLIQIWETFCEHLKYSPEELKGLSWTTLRSLLPVRDKVDMDEWIEKARNMPRTELEKEIDELKAGVQEYNKCSHKWEKIEYWKCKECGETSEMKPINDGKI